MSTDFDIGRADPVRASGAARPEPAAAGVHPSRRWRRRVDRLAHWSAVLWLAFTVAHLVCSDRWWWWALTDLLPPLGFLAVPALLLGTLPLLRAGRRPVAVLALAAALLGGPLSGVHPAAPWQRSASGAEGAVTVVSWNTEYWDDDDDPARFYAYLRALHADVYLLQEYMRADKRGDEVLLRRIDDSRRLRAELPGYHLAVAGELVTLSRLPIVSARSLDAAPWIAAHRPGLPPAAPDFPEVWSQNVLRTDVLVGTRPLTLYNMHLPVQVNLGISPLSGEFHRFLRQAQVRREATMAVLQRDLAANRGPVLLAGDLNSTAAMGVVRRLSLRMAPATPTPGSPYPVSWHGPGPPLFRLDWLFTTANVRADEYRFRDPQGLSDHDAQLARIRLTH